MYQENWSIGGGWELTFSILLPCGSDGRVPSYNFPRPPEES